MNDFKHRVNEIQGEVINIRRDIHMYPELEYEEYRTAGLIADYLKALGLEVQTGIARTGVVGLLRGKRDGKTFGVRADIDAVPQNEEWDSPYASKIPGAHHACGHDAHTAMALGSAKILAGERDRLNGNVKFIFEPAEEKVSRSEDDPVGAELMIAEGCLKNPHVDALLALHVHPLKPAGQVIVQRGVAVSGWSILDISIIGKKAHASLIEEGVDAISVAAVVINGLHAFLNRHVRIAAPCTVHIGAINSVTRGLTRSSLAERVDMEGSLRSVDMELRKNVVSQIEQVIQGITSAYGAQYEMKFLEYLRPVVNNPELAIVVHAAASRALGSEQVSWKDEAHMGGDSFFHFSEKVPSVLAWVGCGGPDEKKRLTWHHPRFELDESCLTAGVATICASAMDFLK